MIEGDWYITGYKPLLDENKKIVGAIALGDRVLNTDVEKFINNIKIGKTGYVYIMNSKVDALIHPSIKGENIGQFDFSKKIINNKRIQS